MGRTFAVQEARFAPETYLGSTKLTRVVFKPESWEYPKASLQEDGWLEVEWVKNGSVLKSYIPPSGYTILTPFQEAKPQNVRPRQGDPEDVPPPTDGDAEVWDDEEETQTSKRGRPKGSKNKR